MLEELHLRNVGPAPKLDLELRPRLNLITGDNGLGKSFLLDVAWWALTRQWPRDLNGALTAGYAARPIDVKEKATISFSVEGKAKSVSYESTYVAREQAWVGKQGRPWNPGLVVYALADGGFAVWDPARNYWKKSSNDGGPERLPGYVFSAQQVWDGLEVAVDGTPTRVNLGLIADWASWIRERGDDARRMSDVLGLLAPSLGTGELKPGTSFARLSINDARDIPTIQTGYGQDVPILYASLGVRRIAALAYMLSWAWREHVIAARHLGEAPTARVVMLFDEVEAHLHPRWQRAIVPALLKVMSTLTRDESADVQLIAATHSPLVMASVEPFFDEEKDRWFDLDFKKGEVVLEHREFVRRGDVGSWLTSDAFDLFEPRSREAEEAIKQALDVVKQPRPTAEDIARVEKLLHASLGETDSFYLRWETFRDAHGAGA